MGGPGWSMFAYQYEYSVELGNVSKRAHGRGHHPSLVVNWDGASSMAKDKECHQCPTRRK